MIDNSGFVASGKSGTKLYLPSQALEVREDQKIIFFLTLVGKSQGNDLKKYDKNNDKKGV